MDVPYQAPCLMGPSERSKKLVGLVAVVIDVLLSAPECCQARLLEPTAEEEGVLFG